MPLGRLRRSVSPSRSPTFFRNPPRRSTRSSCARAIVASWRFRCSPDQIVGALVVRRKTPGEFAKSTIDLLQTFADQSVVVAIQNAGSILFLDTSKYVPG